jgi:tRNA nucleotidyltransferase/poly(A) polymerase
MSDLLSAGMSLLRRLEQAGFESVLVGGAVRDLLLGRSPEDMDIATSAPFQVLAGMFPRGVLTGPEGKQAFLLPLEEIHCEITSYSGSSLERDLARRDFTVNAIALRSTGELVGTRESRRDVAARILRFNGLPADRLAEDSLRAIRFARFAATLPRFSVDVRAFAGIRLVLPSLFRCAPERIGREMRLGLEGDSCVFLRSLRRGGMLRLLFSGPGAGRSALNKLCRALNKLEGGAFPLVRRAAVVFSFGMKSAFPDDEGADLLQRKLARWAWPGSMRSEIAELVRLRMAPSVRFSPDKMARLLLGKGADFWNSLFAIAGAMELTRGGMRRLASDRYSFVQLLARFCAEGELIPSGADLMRRFALSEGPEVGHLLRELRIENLKNGFASKREAIDYAASLLRRS